MLDTTIPQKATMGDNRVLDLQDNTRSDFPYPVVQLQNLYNHRQRVLNRKFTEPLSLFNFRDCTKIRKRIYTYPASFYLGWWKVTRWCKSRLWSIIEVKIRWLPNPHQAQLPSISTIESQCVLPECIDWTMTMRDTCAVRAKFASNKDLMVPMSSQ